jgi:excisionase family DNA binding protein
MLEKRTGGDFMEISTKEIYRIVFREYPDVLDVRQVSQLLGVCEKTVYKLIKDGEFPTMRIGRQHRIAKVSVMKYMRVFNGNIGDESLMSI